MTTYAARVLLRASRWRAPSPAVCAVVLAVALTAGTALVAPLQDRARSADAVDPSDAVLVLAAVLLACAGWSARGRWPATAAVGVTVVVAGYLATGGPYGPIQLVVALCCVTVGAHCRARRAAAVGSMVAVILAAGLATRLTWSWPLGAAAVLVAWSVVFVVLPLLCGVLVRVRRDAAARQRAELLARGAESERLRLAQEVHDIAGHGFSVVSMQAGVALTVFDEQPEQTRRCLEAVQGSADAALRDLHGMLAALRHPVPTAADVPELVERVRAAGLPVELRTGGDPEAGEVDQPVSATVHRVIQEALTNVLRHAGPTTVTVDIVHQIDTVTVTVRDHGRGLPQRAVLETGQGLSGLRARAQSLGGTLAVTDRPAGGVTVEARLPRKAPR